MTRQAEGGFVSWTEFKACWRKAGWLEEVEIYNRAVEVGPGVVSRTTAYCPKFGFPILAFGVLGFVVCLVWSLIGAVA